MKRRDRSLQFIENENYRDGIKYVIHIQKLLCFKISQPPMNIKVITFFSMLAITMTVFTAASNQSAFAETMVSLPAGTSVLGCEETNECYIPSTVTINVGETVTWSNDDTAAHTVTSGTASGGPDGLFDSSLFMAGTTFSHTFEEEGTFDYFCMVHPWMVGTVMVGAVSTEPTAKLVVEAPSEDKTTVTGMSSDGKVRVEITTDNPTADKVVSIDIKFRDSNGGILKQHANYDIKATQNGQEILSVMGAHEHKGEGMHNTAPLASEDAIDIEVTLLGFGLPDDQANWTGPTGEILYFNVVPEFGTIAVMILAIAILSIVAVSARSKLSLTPRI